MAKVLKRCDYPGCDNLETRMGTLCQGHYVQLKRHGELKPLRKTTKTKTFEQQVAEYEAKYGGREPVVLEKCSVEFCDRQAEVAKQMVCKAHYQQQWHGVEYTPIRYTSERQPADSKVRKCNTCCRIKSKDSFYTRVNGKPQPECKVCGKFRARMNYLILSERLDEARAVQASWVAYAEVENKDWASRPHKLNERI